jgi:hypothetical protein
LSCDVFCDRDAGLEQDVETNDDSVMDVDGDHDGVVDDASQAVTKEKAPDNENEDAEDAYQKTKAMGDLD